MKFKFINETERGPEILIYDEIGPSFWGDGLSAKDFANELGELDGEEQITLRINSPGGDVFDGLTMYNSLLRHSARIVAIVEGLAGSIASVILQAADERRIADTAFVMIHDPSAMAYGTAEDLRGLADVLDATRDSILTSYVKRAGESRRDELAQAMSAETWYSASEALEAGLVSSVDPGLKVAACVNDSMIDRFKWRNAPSELLTNSEPAQVQNSRRLALMKLRKRLADR